MFTSEQRSFLMERTVLLMQSRETKGAVAATWILGAGLIGLLGNVTSIAGAALVLGFGLVPPMLMVLWSPVRAMTVRVHQAKP
jgi:hypothetical protein